MNRRQFHCLATATCLSPWFAASRGSAATVERDLEWSCRIVKLEQEPQRRAAPVITGIAVQSVGSRIAVVGDDHLVRVCDMSTGQQLLRLAGHDDWIRAVTFHPAQNLLLTSGNDRRILMWNSEDGELIEEFARQVGAIYAIAYDPLGDRFATVGFQDQLSIYQSSNRQLTQELETPCRDMRCVSFSPDGTKLAAGGRSGTIRVWDTESGRVLRDLTAHRRRVHDVLFNDDGSAVISCAEDRTIKVIPLQEGAAAIEMPRRPCKVNAIAKLGGDMLASGGSDNLIRLWDLANQTEIGHLIGHRGTVTSVAFDGLALYTGGYDTELRIWTVSPEVAERLQSLPRIGRGGVHRSIN